MISLKLLLRTSLPLAGSVLFLVGTCHAQGADAPRYSDSPPEVTVLKHSRGFTRKFTTERVPQSENGGEPPTRVVSKSVMTIKADLKSNTTRSVAGISWYFIVQRNPDDVYFRIPFVSPIQIDGGKTKTVTGEIRELPRGHRRAVTVDELQNPDKTPAQERIVISCVLFADGTVSSLNDASKTDCNQLQASPQIRKKLQNSGAQPLN